MTGFFEPARDGSPRLVLDDVERGILRSLAVQLLEMVGPGPGEDEPDDPLARLFQEGPTEKPDDPALARLFPDAYGEDEERGAERSAEFRKYTEPDLRQRKRDDALGTIRSLDAAVPGRRKTVELVLGADETRHWLGTLNDLRLTLGTRLDVAEDDERVYAMPDSDPEKPLMMAYLWLGGLQETLLGVMSGE